MRRIAALLLLGLLAGCSSQPVKPLPAVSHVQLPRYMGTWHVIAHIPNFAERDKLATADEYHLKPDGSIAVTYHFRASFQDPPDAWHGSAWLPDPSDTARWKVRIIWPFTSRYVIVALDPQYRYVMVGRPARDLLWIMARGLTMPAGVYSRYVDKARREGFPVDKLVKVPQKASQVGRPGFE